MKTKRLFSTIFLFASLCYLDIIIAQTVTIDGSVKLNGHTIFDNIKVLFEMTAPSTSVYTVFSNSDGTFTVEIKTGIYKVTYSKNGYFPIVIIDQAYYSNATLSEQSLKPKGTCFFVPTDVSTIQSAIDYANTNDTIIVEPGIYYENINFHG